MDLRFQDYGTEVCRFIHHATAKEKAAICKELTDHMEDHAQALMDGGFPEDHAIQIALESMGEAEAVGRELDKEYPRHWGILVTVFQITLLLLACYLLLFSINWNPNHIFHTIEARTDPVSGHRYIPTHAGDIYPLELRQELPGGTVLNLYGVARDTNGQVWVYAVSYPKNPFQNSINTAASLTFTCNEADVTLYDRLNIETSGICPLASYHRYCLQEVQEGDILTAHYDHYGFSFAWEIPWEEASP